MKTVYVVTANSDRIEGRGPTNYICVTESKELATKICEGKAYAVHYGGMGHPGDESDVKELKLIESEEEFEKIVPVR